MTKDLECYKSQITIFENKEKREKSFEAAFHEYYHKEQNLQHQMRELIESNGKLVSQLENEKSELKKQVEQHNTELSKTKTELSTCQANFSEHKKLKRKSEDLLIGQIVDLECQLKEFQNIVYKTGGSVTSIQKFTLKPNPNRGFALGDNKPRFLHSTLKENPKIYSIENMLDDSVIRVVVHDTEEEE